MVGEPQAMRKRGEPPDGKRKEGNHKEREDKNARHKDRGGEGSELDVKNITEKGNQKGEGKNQTKLCKCEQNQKDVSFVNKLPCLITHYCVKGQGNLLTKLNVSKFAISGGLKAEKKKKIKENVDNNKVIKLENRNASKEQKVKKVTWQTVTKDSDGNEHTLKQDNKKKV